MGDEISTMNLDLDLKNLADDYSIRKKTGVLRDYYETIDSMKKKGVPNISIVECLNNAGLKISLKVFETLFYRLRREKLQKPNLEIREIIPDKTNERIRAPPKSRIENAGDIKRSREVDIDLEKYL